jgi:hypothetical protein
MTSWANHTSKNKTRQNRGITRNWRALALMLVLLTAQGAVAQDEDRIWQGLFNYQQKMANIGNAEAQYKLAGMYAQGQGVKADPAQARHWYEKSAAQGYEPAQHKLAALDAGEPRAKTSAPVPAAPPPLAAPAPIPQPAKPAQPDVSRQELERVERERKQLEQELARSREEMRKMQEAQARRDAELKKAEAEKEQARRRLAAKALLEAEMKKLKETPSAFDQ